MRDSGVKLYFDWGKHVGEIQSMNNEENNGKKSRKSSTKRTGVKAGGSGTLELSLHLRHQYRRNHRKDLTPTRLRSHIR